MDVRSAAAIVGVLLVLVVAGIVVARLLRARASRMPPPMPTPEPLAGSEAAFLDSSHIISGPLLGAAEGRSDVAGGAAGNGGGAGTRNGPGPRQ